MNSDAAILRKAFTPIHPPDALSTLPDTAHVGTLDLTTAPAAALEDSGVGGNEDDEDVPELEVPEDDGPVDETGVDPKDIDLVMAQVSCSRAKAVRVLKESGGDLINASTFHFLACHRLRCILISCFI